jgi:hypothetical protein
MYSQGREIRAIQSDLRKKSGHSRRGFWQARHREISGLVRRLADANPGHPSVASVTSTEGLTVDSARDLHGTRNAFTRQFQLS